MKCKSQKNELRPLYIPKHIEKQQQKRWNEMTDEKERPKKYTNIVLIMLMLKMFAIALSKASYKFMEMRYKIFHFANVICWFCCCFGVCILTIRVTRVSVTIDLPSEFHKGYAFPYTLCK